MAYQLESQASAEDYAEINDTVSTSSVTNRRTYEIDRSRLVLSDILGVGQFGDVFIGFLSTRSGDSLKVAVKTCKLDNEHLMADKLLEEAYSMEQFHHPHIIQLIGICSDEPVWIVMELAQHGELRSFLKEHKSALPILTLVTYCLQVCMALSYLESKKFVHRDIAARNVLVSSYECVKLADFGLSRWVDDESYYTASKGKLPIKWMAPESINFRKFTHSTDCGCSVFVCGKS